MTAPDDHPTIAQDPAQLPDGPPRSQLEGLGKRKKRVKTPKTPKTGRAPQAGTAAKAGTSASTSRANRAARKAERKAAGTPREQPSAYKLIAAVALIVALDILLFFAIGYVLGKQIL